MSDRKKTTPEALFEVADQKVTDASLAGDPELLARALRARALAWRAWAATLEPGGMSHTGAMLAALRDETEAYRYEEAGK